MLNKGNAASITAAVQTLQLRGGETVADIGFGGGFGLGLLLEATRDGGQVHGVEPSADMLTRAAKTRGSDIAAGRLHLHNARMDSLPFADGALDGWISVNTIYFVDDLGAALREMRRVLSPGARGVIGIADPRWMSRQAFTKHGFALRPVTDVVAAMEYAGLTTEHHTTGGPEATFHLLTGTH
ncbi:class I SAM-dependent methyltransferase [Nostocoides japonicum]|nr:methyltransferase domain-containing protein [Tetrasphaera japonica]